MQFGFVGKRDLPKGWNLALQFLLGAQPMLEILAHGPAFLLPNFMGAFGNILVGDGER